MPPVDPTTYAWLSDSELDEAGCFTVVPDAEPDAVARAFGHDPADDGDASGESQERFADRSALGRLGDRGTEIWVAAPPGPTVVFEFNGFEGARSEVLREASRIGTAKVAASLYWSVNGAVQVTCARRGKVVASLDLSYVEEDDLTDVPRVLRRLARLCIGDEDTDLLAVGAAMVETYVGVGFARADLDGSRARHIVSRPSDLSTYTPSAHYGPFDQSLPGAQEAFDALPPESLRRLAEWSALAAVREAGLTEDPAVRMVLDQLGSGVATSLPPGLEALGRRFAAESERQSRLMDEYDEASAGSLARNHSWLPGHAIESLRYTSHADAYSAAMGALTSATRTYSCTRLDRGARFVDDQRGRHQADHDPPLRLEAFTDVVRQVLAADPAQWDDLAGLLPMPLSAAELAAAVEVDRRLQEAGAFDTWHVAGDWSRQGRGEDDDELVVFVDHEAEVMERYRELERRDRAIVARGPIAVEVLAPANAGGFAVAMSDGVRIERLPAGQVVGALWLTFVLTSEFGVDFWNSRGRRSSPEDRIEYSGPDGLIRPAGNGGGRDGSFFWWHTQIRSSVGSWVRLDYLDGGKSVASETIELA